MGNGGERVGPLEPGATCGPAAGPCSAHPPIRPPADAAVSHARGSRLHGAISQRGRGGAWAGLG